MVTVRSRAARFIGQGCDINQSEFVGTFEAKGTIMEQPTRNSKEGAVSKRVSKKLESETQSNTDNK